MDVRSALKSALPPARFSRTQSWEGSTHAMNPDCAYMPEHVDLWDEEEPGSNSSGALLDAIIQHQEDADKLYTDECLSEFQVDMQPVFPLDTESAVFVAAAQQMNLLNKLRAGNCAWHCGVPLHDIAAAVPVTFEVPRPGASNCSTAQQPQQVEYQTLPQRQRNMPQCYDPAGEASGSSTPNIDIAFAVNSMSMPQGEEARRLPGLRPEALSTGTNVVQREEHRRYIFVVKMEKPAVLTTRKATATATYELSADDLQVVDLVEAWRQSSSACEVVNARKAVIQLYTYMQLSGACYGAIDCYFFRWLAYCPPGNRSTLYLSAPISSATSYEEGAPAATSLGSMAWLQHRATQHAVSNPPQEPLDRSGAARQNHGEGGVDAGQNDEGSRGAGCSDKDIMDDERDAGECTGSADKRNPPSKTRQDKRTRRDQGVFSHRQSVTVVVELHRKICTGSEGAVMLGAYDGQPAVVKLLGPNRQGLAAWAAEVDMYDQLGPQQGHLVPAMLGAGHWKAGVHFIAVSLVNGSPLCDSRVCLSAPVIAAAQRTLQQLQQAVPGFLHDDIRLPNIMLLEGSGMSDMDIACMLIDFGRSCSDGTPAEQRREMKQLQRLLKQ